MGMKKWQEILSTVSTWMIGAITDEELMSELRAHRKARQMLKIPVADYLEG